MADFTVTLKIPDGQYCYCSPLHVCQFAQIDAHDCHKSRCTLFQEKLNLTPTCGSSGIMLGKCKKCIEAIQ